MVRIGTLPMLTLLAAAAWAVPVWEALYLGSVSALSMATATMFTLMVAAWPFVNGRRLSHGRAEKAMMCRDCHNLRWPNETLGFCIHCGSARPAVQMAY